MIGMSLHYCQSELTKEVDRHGMSLYRYSFTILLFVFLVMPCCAFADKPLSDDEAYSRVYSYCYSRVAPMWSPKQGEKPPKRTSADRERNARKTVECMNEVGVPVRYDMSAGIVRTGKDFGKDIKLKPEDIFPESVASPDTIAREMPDAVKALIQARQAGNDKYFPRIDIKELVPPDLRGRTADIDFNSEEAISSVPDFLRSRLKGNESESYMPDDSDSAEAVDFGYSRAEKSSQQPVNDNAVARKNEAVNNNDEFEATSKSYSPEKSADGELSSGNVSAAGQEDGDGGYRVKPIFLGR